MRSLARPPRSGPRGGALRPALRLAVGVLAAAASLALLRPEGIAGPAALLGAPDADVAEEPAPGGGPLDWLHYKVIIASHTGYPLALMFGFNCFGNVLLRKECGGKPYPNWLFGYLLGFVCYTYPSAVFSDLVFVSDVPRAMANNNILFIYTFWFLVIQNSETVYNMLTQKHTFVLLTTWWLADATRASMCFLERAVADKAIFARGVFQCFIWCSAGPIMRVAEASIRGAKVTPLEQVQPNSLNAFKYPLVAMFMIMMSYMVFLWKFTECNLFEKGGLSMVECGQQHDDVYAAFVYLACFLHVARSVWSIYGANDTKMIFDHCMCGT